MVMIARDSRRIGPAVDREQDNLTSIAADRIGNRQRQSAATANDGDRA
jgi:hypothetical protein